ncbi:MAG: chemotaxis protein CheD [Eubacterium sp.]|nr:chemotaxis protein CheD [Eubacterium sp.]
MGELIRVGMADYKICRTPQKISTLGLGSCLGVVLYDESSGICGMAHVMLPDSTRIPSQQSNRFKFMDTCLKDMYDELTTKNRIPSSKLKAKIAGGAKMFAHRSTNSMLNVGEQNITKAKEMLGAWRIPIKAEDTGDRYGRTITFDPSNSELHIKTVGVGESVI